MATKYIIRPASEGPPPLEPAASSQPEVLQVSPGAPTGAGNPANPTLPPTHDLPRKPAEYAKNFLKSSGAIPVMWAVAMGLVFVDEWSVHRILARPARLWWSSIAYFILAVAAHFEPIRPIAVLIAIGLTLQLGYQFFNHEGQFTHGQ